VAPETTRPRRVAALASTTIYPGARADADRCHLRAGDSDFRYDERVSGIPSGDEVRLTARELPDWLIANGRHWVTLDQVSELLGVPPEQVPPAMARLAGNGQVFSPLRGTYVPVPPEYRSWGAVPASHFVDAMMSHLGRSYYVGLLSAAEIHGAAHQRPQVFQVVTTGRLRDREFGRVKVEFISDAHSYERPVGAVNVPTGTMRVSTAEVTVLDLVARPDRGGGLSNVATVAGELLQDGKLNAGSLAKAASTYRTSVIQRAGWLLDNVAGIAGVIFDTGALLELAGRRTEPTSLVASAGRVGPVDTRWNVRVNATIEPEL